MPPTLQIGMQTPAPPRPIYVAQPQQAQERQPPSNPLADHYQALSDHYASQIGQPDPSWNQDTKNFYAERNAFWGSPKPPAAKTVYHANGQVSNPPAQDPGFSVYNHLSQMPAEDQAQIHAFRNGTYTAPAPNQQMMPDPSKQTPAIGVPSRSQLPQSSIGVGGGFQSVRPTAPPNFQSHADMRRTMLQGLSGQMRDAQAKGDMPGLYGLFAQRAALDNGGFAGHAKFMQDQAMHEAQIGKLGGGSGGVPRGKDGLLDTEAARMLGFKETNSAAGGDAFAQNAQVQNLSALEKQGKPYTVDPALAGPIIESRASHLSPLFKTDQQGAPTLSPQEILAGLNAKDPRLFENPSSLPSRASLEMLRQLHGQDLDKKLELPANPLDYQPGGAIGGMIGPMGRITLGGVGASLDNLFHWRGGVVNPYGEFTKQSEASALYNALLNPNK